MYNLFVVHTQYNLILASGLASNVYKHDCNDLILFHDFDLSDELLHKLQSVFKKVEVLEGNVPAIIRTILQKFQHIKLSNQKIRRFMCDAYDRVWIVDDMCIPEMYVLKCARKKNKTVEMAWLEDGSNAYFSNSDISEGMGATPLKRWIRKIVFSVLYGLGSCYDLGLCMGSHKMLKKLYLTYPLCVRRELADRECVEISAASFKKGMQMVYAGDRIDFEANSVLIAMDKLDVYGERIEKVNDLIKELLDQAAREGRKVYYKYHPREIGRLPALETAEELNRSIALEYFLSSSSTKDLQIVGIKSTALQTSAKMNYDTISLIALLDDVDPAILDFYQKIGITVL